MSHLVTLEPFHQHVDNVVFLEQLEASYDQPLGPARGSFLEFYTWLVGKPVGEAYAVLWDNSPVGVFVLTETTVPELVGVDAWATTTLLTVEARGRGINTLLKTSVAYGFSRIPATLYSVVRSSNPRSLAAIAKVGAAHLVHALEDGRNFFIYDNFDVSGTPVCPVQETILEWYASRNPIQMPVAEAVVDTFGGLVPAEAAPVLAELVTGVIPAQEAAVTAVEAPVVSGTPAVPAGW